MKVLGYLATIGFLVLGFFLYSIPSLPSALASTITVYATTTTTIIGYAFPSGTTLGYGLVAFFLPLFITVLFVMIARMAGLEGDISSFIIKLCILVGCILGMLSLTDVAPTLVPFAFPIVAGIYFITYLWKRV